MRTYRKIFTFLVFVIIVIFAFVVRLEAVNNLPIDYDEDDYLLAGQELSIAFKGDYHLFLDLNYRPEHPQLAKILFGAILAPLPVVAPIPDRPSTAPPALSLPQPHLTIVRMTNSILNVINVALIAIINPVAGFFLAIHTYTIKYSSQVMLEALPMLTATLTVLFYKKSNGNSTKWLILTGAMLGLTAAAKYIYAVVGIAVVFDLLLKNIRSENRQIGQFFKNLGILIISGTILFFATQPYLWVEPIQRLWYSITFHGGYAQSQTVQNSNFPIWQPFTWLFTSVPWHPSIFYISLDLLIAFFALVGLKSLYTQHSPFFWWLTFGLGFLIIWPTKWPQYILVVSAPVCLSAGLGFQYTVRSIYTNFRQMRIKSPVTQQTRKKTLRSLIWLLPGTLVIATIAIYPLIFQGAMSLTDFSAGSIRDGLNGGVWREVWLGITGQVEPVPVRLFSFNPSREVNYSGFNLLLDAFFSFEGGSLLVFELIWSSLTVFFQTALGVVIAIILSRKWIRFRNFWLVLFILPWAIPEFIGALMWLQFFHPNFGWFVLAQNSFFQRVDLPFITTPIVPAWQNNPTMALLYLLIPAIWYGFPFMMVAAVASLKAIPFEVDEAAAIDGAVGWLKFQFITWPMLMPLIVPAMIIRLIFSFNQFYLFLMFETPFPVTSLAATSYYIFSDGGAYALSAAINIMALIFLVFGILLFNRWTRAAQGVTYAG